MTNAVLTTIPILVLIYVSSGLLIVAVALLTYCILRYYHPCIVGGYGMMRNPTGPVVIDHRSASFSSDMEGVQITPAGSTHPIGGDGNSSMQNWFDGGPVPTEPTSTDSVNVTIGANRDTSQSTNTYDFQTQDSPNFRY